MRELFESMMKVFERVFFTPLGEMTLIEVIAGGVACLVAAAIVFVAYKLVRWLLTKFKGGLRTTFSAKAKCQRIQCTSCGRTLDKCICVKNKEKGYLGRVLLYRREQRLRKKKQKLQKMTANNKK